jgi:hypothetical protein
MLPVVLIQLKPGIVQYYSGVQIAEWLVLKFLSNIVSQSSSIFPNSGKKKERKKFKKKIET